MATAKELGLKHGDIVIWGSAWRYERGGGMLCGIPLDTPGAEVKIGAGKVIAVDTPSKYGTDYPTHINVLWTNHDPSIVGQDIEIHSGFRNYIGEGDERLAKQLRGAGISIRTVTERSGDVSFELQKENSGEL